MTASSSSSQRAITPRHLVLAEQQARLPKRSPDSHKYAFGPVLVVGGDAGMLGAPYMAAMGAARVGAGLVMLATHAAKQPFAAEAEQDWRPEIMHYQLTSCDDLLPLLEKAKVIVVGPGLGQSAWSHAMLEAVLASHHPVVVDADALHLLAQKNIQRDNWVLTPHVGEAAVLLNCASETIQSDRLTHCQAIQTRYGGVAVLKGQGTLLCGPDQTPAMCDAGNPGMASGGMGDILSGMIGGLLAQDLSGWEAACTGVMIHASAGDLAAQAQGERGLLAMDLLPYIRQLMNP